MNAADGLELEIMEQVRIHSAKKAAVSLCAEIYKDLGIYGMDVWEIANYLHKKYGTRFDNFPMDKYAPPESFIPPWLRKKILGEVEYKSLTIKHFAQAVRQGAWVEPAPTEHCD